MISSGFSQDFHDFSQDIGMLSPWASLPLASAWASTCPACCALDGWDGLEALKLSVG